MTSARRYRPHLLPVDRTLHWANPPGGTAGRDTRPGFTTTPGSYRGPVPIVTHLHGAHVLEESDGYPEAWYLPAATDLPHGYARVGTFYERFKAESAGRPATRCSTTATTSVPPRCGTTTTRWA